MNQDKYDLLTRIGLKEVMIEKNYSDPFNKESFVTYTSKEYLQSDRKQTDEIYRMSEIVLLHRASGLRVEYVTTESYFGDEYSYRLKDIFIVTKKEQVRLHVTKVDFDHSFFITQQGKVLFTEVSLDRQ
ncbi:MAG: hypothetical protein JNL53_20805 [Cyclobacteriaceae bacterium]|nr:hypothetical protein [Cyclobacteriaceae bacterium]